MEPRRKPDRVARAVIHKQRNVETVITNVPGPRSPLYLSAHRMIEGYPVAPIAGLVRIGVAIWSYCEHLYIGVTGDRDSASDIDRLGRGNRQRIRGPHRRCRTGPSVTWGPSLVPEDAALRTASRSALAWAVVPLVCTDTGRRLLFEPETTIQEDRR